MDVIDILKNKKGFIAALDQSGGSIKKTLINYGVKESDITTEEVMFNYIHSMRSRVISNKYFDERIIGVILFEHTMKNDIEGLNTVKYLKEKGIPAFLKIDVGLEDESDGVRLLKDIPNLDERLEEAKKYGIIGTKERSVILEYNEYGIKKVIEQQFKLAKQIIAHGLIPIIEPETTITSEDREQSESLLHDLIKEHLNKLDDNVRIILKISIPVNPHLYDDILLDKHVLRIVALSGGFSQELANQKLKHIKGLIASFSRALLEGLTYQQSEIEFDNTISNSINKIYDASVNKQL